MTDTGPAPEGHNNPPEKDPFLERLERESADLFKAFGAAALDEMALPKPEAIKTEEDVAKVNTFVAQMKGFARQADKRRETEKADFLRLGRIVDGFFKKTIEEPFLAKAAAAEARLVPYLRAKREKEEARRREEQERARVAAAEAAERERVERAAAQARAQEAEAAQARIRQAKDDEERERAADEMQTAEAARALSQTAADQAAMDTAGATRLAEQHERALTGPVSKLSRTSAGGSSASLDEFWAHSITDGAALDASLGPLGPFFPAHEITGALNRLAEKHGGEVTVPGVRFYKDHRARVRTRAPATPAT